MTYSTAPKGVTPVNYISVTELAHGSTKGKWYLDYAPSSLSKSTFLVKFATSQSSSCPIVFHILN